MGQRHRLVNGELEDSEAYFSCLNITNYKQKF